jgi:hypothetical protein
VLCPSIPCSGQSFAVCGYATSGKAANVTKPFFASSPQFQHFTPTPGLTPISMTTAHIKLQLNYVYCSKAFALRSIAVQVNEVENSIARYRAISYPTLRVISIRSAQKSLIEFSSMLLAGQSASLRIEALF